MTSAQALTEIQHLTDTINYHNDLYYQKNKTEISDQEFDLLLKKLEHLEKEFPELKTSRFSNTTCGRKHHEGIRERIPQVPDALAGQHV
jgi:NAD-dependent DNA ligase